MSAVAPAVDDLQRLPLGPTLLRVALLPALLLAAFVLVLIWQVDRLRDELDWVTHTDAVITQAHETLISALSLQTTLRGYLVTGKPDHLAAHIDYRAKSRATVDQLVMDVADNPEQVTTAQGIKTLIEKYIAYGADILEVKARGGDVAAHLEIGEGLVGELRTALAELTGRERVLQRQRGRAVQTTAMYIIASGFVFLLAGGLVFTFVARRELRRITETYRTALTTATEDRRRLEEARDVAEAANHSKDQFLAMVSHELRNPLMPILTWAVLLRDRKLTDDQRHRGIDSIERSARSLTQLIDDLLDVSRIVSGKLRLDVRPIELAPVINAALEASRPAAEAKQVRLQVVLDPRAGPIAGDPERLQQVVWNLLSNAIKFTPKGGRVHVALSRVSSHVELAVSDSGEGIDAALLPHVFDRFWQAESGSTRQRTGLGLGLAIVRHLTELHGGTVEAHSDGIGAGSVFKVQLPLLVTAHSPGEVDTQTALRSEGAPPQRLTGVRVMVVDDDVTSLEAIAMLLSRSGAEVRMAASAAHALEAMRQWQPAVLLSDIEMPGQDGYALIRIVRTWSAEDGGKIPAVALTAYARIDDRVRVLAAGFQMHVTKPVDPAELVAVVASLASRGQPLSL